MKKILAVVLTVMMLFATVAIGASAQTTSYDQWFGGEDPIANSDQAVFYFYFNGGTNKTTLQVYDTIQGSIVAEAGSVTGTYIMLPRNDQEQKAGYYITLPQVTAPDGRAFDGWQCMSDRQYYVGGTQWFIPENAGGTIIEFQAAYSAAAPAEDTLGTVLGILIKVFGAILGIVLYSGDTEQGVAMMEKVLGGLF